MEALNSGDAAKIGSLFTEDARFDDGGARPFGFDDLYSQGREKIEQAFAGVFSQFKVKAELLETKKNMMFYNVTLGDLFIPCIGIVEEKDGLIKAYTVRPRIQNYTIYKCKGFGIYFRAFCLALL